MLDTAPRIGRMFLDGGACFQAAEVFPEVFWCPSLSTVVTAIYAPTRCPSPPAPDASAPTSTASATTTRATRRPSPCSGLGSAPSPRLSGRCASAKRAPLQRSGSRLWTSRPSAGRWPTISRPRGPESRPAALRAIAAGDRARCSRALRPGGIGCTVPRHISGAARYERRPRGDRLSSHQAGHAGQAIDAPTPKEAAPGGANTPTRA